MIYNVGLESTVGLFALLSLLYLILLYLIRPKPETITIPSLMFFIKEKGESRIRSFLKNFLRDMLLLFQFLAILFLAAQIAQPYTFINKDISSKNLVFVIDVSASSQAREGSTTRFESSIETVKSMLGESNTIILAKDIAVVGIEDANREDALDYLRTITPKDTGTRLGEAIMLAGQLLGEREGRVIVLSDFINTDGISPLTSKAILESKSIIIDFINTASEKTKSNVGIVNLNIDDKSSTIYIKNYDLEDKTITLSINNNEQSINLKPNSIEAYSFQTPDDITEIRIKDKDDFMADNLAYVSNPLNKQIKILLLTNNKSFYLEKVLTSIDNVELTINEPPIISKEMFDIFIFHDILADQILPGTFEDIQQNVQNSSSVVIHAQQDLPYIDYKGLLPVKITAILNKESPITVDLKNQLTRYVEFGSLKKSFITDLAADTLSLASIDNHSLLSYKILGEGKLFYYGILEDKSDFKLSPYYPIFWNNLVKFLTDKGSIKVYNLKSGETLILKQNTIISTPLGSIVTNTLVLDKIGIYSYSNKEIAVNLFNEKESDINLKPITGIPIKPPSLEPIRKQMKYPLELILLSLAALFVLLELLYVKFRGDV